MPSKERPAASLEVHPFSLNPSVHACKAFCKDLKGKFAPLAMNSVDYVVRCL